MGKVRSEVTQRPQGDIMRKEGHERGIDAYQQIALVGA